MRDASIESRQYSDKVIINDAHSEEGDCEDLSDTSWKNLALPTPRESGRTNLIYPAYETESVAWKDMRDRKIPPIEIDSFYEIF